MDFQRYRKDYPDCQMKQDILANNELNTWSLAGAAFYLLDRSTGDWHHQRGRSGARTARKLAALLRACSLPPPGQRQADNIDNIVLKERQPDPSQHRVGLRCLGHPALKAGVRCQRGG